VIDRVKSYGGKVSYPVGVPLVSEYMIDGSPATIIAIRESLRHFSSRTYPGSSCPRLGHVFEQNVNEFLQLYETSEIRSVRDIIEYNKKHADKELPTGESDAAAQNTSS
jgi:hypothetical protein